MKLIQVCDLAELDLDAIWCHIAFRSGSLDIADGVVESITQAFAVFAMSPEAGTRRDEILQTH